MLPGLKKPYGDVAEILIQGRGPCQVTFLEDNSRQLFPCKPGCGLVHRQRINHRKPALQIFRDSMYELDSFRYHSYKS
jgi:hypothetical protein